MPFYRFPNGEVHDLNLKPYDGAAVQLSRSEGVAARAEYCRKELRKLIRPKATVSTVLRHVSRSGMQRKLSLVIVHKGEILDITTLAAGAMHGRTDDDGNLVVRGCGMDMCWNAVYRLGKAIWPNGTRRPHGTRNGQPDSDGGYALNHRHL